MRTWKCSVNTRLPAGGTAATILAHALSAPIADSPVVDAAFKIAASLAVLPESADSLRALAALGQQDLAEYLEDWQRAQGARLHHFTAQLTSDQLAVVRETLEPFLAQVAPGDGGNPNRQGLALLLLCQTYRELREGSM